MHVLTNCIYRLLWCYFAIDIFSPEMLKAKVNREPKTGPLLSAPKSHLLFHLLLIGRKKGAMDFHLLWLHSVHPLHRPDPPLPDEAVFH